MILKERKQNIKYIIEENWEFLFYSSENVGVVLVNYGCNTWISVVSTNEFNALRELNKEQKQQEQKQKQYVCKYGRK